MKKTRKVLSLLLALSMLCTVFGATVSVSAATDSASVVYVGDRDLKANGWTIEYKTSNTSFDNRQDYAALNATEGVSKSPAMVVNYASPAEANRYIKVTNSFGYALPVESTYRLSYSIKSTKLNGFKVSLNGNDVSDFTKGETDESGFTTYYKDYTVSADNCSDLSFVISDATNCVIDNVSLKKVENGETTGDELITNGDFAKFSLECGETGQVLYGDFPNTNAATATQYWAKEFRRVSNECFVNATTLAHSGKYALYSKWSGGTESEKFNRLINYNNALTLEAGDYILELWAKSSGKMDNKVKASVLWDDDLQVSTWGEPVETDENGWSKYRVKKTNKTKKENKYFSFLFDQDLEVIIDDVVYAKDENGNGIIDANEPNLVKDSGFEEFFNNKAHIYDSIDGEYKFDKWPLSHVKWTEQKSDISELGGVWYGTNFHTNHTVDKTTYVEPSIEAYEGKYGMHIVKADQYGGNDALIITKVVSVPAEELTVEFYAKGYNVGALNFFAGGFSLDSIKDYGRQWGDGSSGSFVPAVVASNFTQTTVGTDGWVKYTGKYTPEAARGSWSFRLNDNTLADIYIDNLSIKTASGTELVMNGDFESAGLVSGNNRTIGHLMAASAVEGKGLNVSWTNPKSNMIEDITVKVGGKLYRNSAVDLSNGAFNEMFIGGLENNKEYDIEVVAVCDGEKVTATAKGTPDDRGQWYVQNGWNVNRFAMTQKVDGTEYPNRSNFTTSLDSETSVSGNSMKLEFNDKHLDNYYPNISQSVKVNIKDEHVLTVKSKNDGLTNYFVILNYSYTEEGVTHNTWTPVALTGETDENGWTVSNITLDNDLKGTSNEEALKCRCGEAHTFYDTNTDREVDLTLYFACDTGFGTLWLDDIGLYVSDFGEVEEGSENLLVNGSFDETYKISTVFTNADGEEIDSITAGETVKVTAKVTNYVYTDGLNAFVAVALYKNGALDKIVETEGKAAVNGNYPPDTFDASFDIPKQTGDSSDVYTIKVMYWDGESTMKPYVTAAELK